MPRLKGGKTRVEEEGAEHISTQDVEDAQLRATLAATHVDELRAQVADCSRRQRAKRPRDVVGGAKKRRRRRRRMVALTTSGGPPSNSKTWVGSTVYVLTYWY